MTRTIAPETFEFLKKEIALWEEGNILKREQGDSIVAGYEIRRPRTTKITVFMFAGCMLLGTSLTALVGLNHFSLIQKYEVLIFLAVAFAVFTFQGWTLVRSSGEDRSVADAHLLLGAIIFADAVALATQMFNFSTTESWEAVAGALCLLPIALLTRSGPVLVACNSVIAMWAITTNVSTEYKVAAAAIALMAAYFLRNRWALGLALVACPVSLSLYNSWERSATLPLMLGVGLLSWHMWHMRSGTWRNMAMPYLIASLFLACLQPMQQMGGYGQDHYDLVLQSLAVAIALGACLARSRRLLFLRVSALLLVIVLAGCPSPIGSWNVVDFVPYLLTNILLLLYCAKVVDNPWFIGAPLLAIFICLCHFASDLMAVSVGALVAGCVVLLSVIVARRKTRLGLSLVSNIQLRT